MRMCARRQVAVVLVGVHHYREAELTHVVEAANPLSRFLGRPERGQKHARENSNDGDDHEQFDEGESGLISFWRFGCSRHTSSQTNKRLGLLPGHSITARDFTTLLGV